MFSQMFKRSRKVAGNRLIGRFSRVSAQAAVLQVSDTAHGPGPPDQEPMLQYQSIGTYQAASLISASRHPSKPCYWVSARRRSPPWLDQRMRDSFNCSTVTQSGLHRLVFGGRRPFTMARSPQTAARTASLLPPFPNSEVWAMMADRRRPDRVVSCGGNRKAGR